ncbi:MAG: glycosyltransferase family 9 protein, partial [Edaphobacter sp.]
VRWRPEVLIYLSASRGVAVARRDAAFFRLCGIRRLVGIPITDDMQQSRWQESEQALEPEAARLARNLAELGDAHLDDPQSWDLHLTPEEHARAAEVLRPVLGHPIIAVSVGTKVQAKDWGRENWRALLAQLATFFPGHALILSGSPQESEASEFAADGWRQAPTSAGPVVNLCGHLTPRESAAAFAQAQLFIGHDSGPMHLAAAVQTPCVAIFAARNKPRVWFPYGRQHRILYHQTDCWGCGLETCIVERKKCITSITVDEVLAEIRAALG